MRTKILLLNALIMVVFFCSANAQNKPEPKPCVVQTMYLKAPMGPDRLNVDSLVKVYKKSFIDPNPYITSAKILMHWWGHDSRELVIIYQLKSFDDLNKAFTKQRELQIDYVKEHKEFLNQWLRLAEDSFHSDEIYRVVAE